MNAQSRITWSDKVYNQIHRVIGHWRSNSDDVAFVAPVLALKDGFVSDMGRYPMSFRGTWFEISFPTFPGQESVVVVLSETEDPNVALVSVGYYQFEVAAHSALTAARTALFACAIERIDRVQSELNMAEATRKRNRSNRRGEGSER